MPTKISKTALWLGRLLSFGPSLFLLVDAVMKFFKPAPVIEATLALGLSEELIIPMGVILLVSTLLYLIPRTAALGGILLTGYLGGAVAIHVRVGNGPVEIFFPIVFGVLLWAGLYLRDPDVRRVVG